MRISTEIYGDNTYIREHEDADDYSLIGGFVATQVRIHARASVGWQGITTAILPFNWIVT